MISYNLKIVSIINDTCQNYTNKITEHLVESRQAKWDKGVGYFAR